MRTYEKLVENLSGDVPAPDSVASMKHAVSAEEWQLRVDLAATYRLVALYGWDDLIFTHISARIPGPEHHFLINPYGLLFEEITASSLVKIDLEGRKVAPSPYPVNSAGFAIHSAIHMNRDDAHCVIHLHTDDGVAVSAQADGLLPLDQHAMAIGSDLAYHDYDLVNEREECEKLVRDAGDKHLLMLRNHGTLTMGRNCADAFVRMFYFERACSMQVRALAGGVKLCMPNQGIARRIGELAAPGFDGPLGSLSWPALIRKLDRIDPSYKH